MKKTIILNQVDLHTTVDAASRLIAWAYETCHLNSVHDVHFSLKSRFPNLGEVKCQGLPIELCGQKVLEITIDQEF